MDGKTWTIEGVNDRGKSLGCLVWVIVEFSPVLDNERVDFLLDKTQKFMNDVVEPGILDAKEISTTE